MESTFKNLRPGAVIIAPTPYHPQLVEADDGFISQDSFAPAATTNPYLTTFIESHVVAVPVVPNASAPYVPPAPLAPPVPTAESTLVVQPYDEAAGPVVEVPPSAPLPALPEAIVQERKRALPQVQHGPLSSKKAATEQLEVHKLQKSLDPQQLLNQEAALRAEVQQLTAKIKQHPHLNAFKWATLRRAAHQWRVLLQSMNKPAEALPPRLSQYKTLPKAGQVKFSEAQVREQWLLQLDKAVAQHNKSVVAVPQPNPGDVEVPTIASPSPAVGGPAPLPESRPGAVTTPVPVSPEPGVEPLPGAPASLDSGRTDIAPATFLGH